MKAVQAIAAGAAAALFSGALLAQSTLDAVKSKGYVQCGVNTGLAGFSQPDSRSVWKGLDVDSCRAVAAAVFGAASTRPISASLLMGPSRPRTPSFPVKAPSNSGSPSSWRP